MKRSGIIIAVLLVLCLSVGYAVAAGGPNGTYEGFPVVLVKVNGQAVAGDIPAINFYGRTMVPVRFVSEALGAAVDWNADTWTASVALANVGQLQIDLAAARTRISELETQLAGKTSSPTQPPAGLKSKIETQLGNYIKNVTIAGKALSFWVADVTPNYTLLDETYTRIFVNIEPSLWINYLDIIIEGKTPQISTWANAVGTYTASLCDGGKFRITLFYQNTFSSYPSSYDPGEITLDSTTFKWRVTHIFCTVDNLKGIVKVDVR